MPIHHFAFSEQIAGSPEVIFDLVADMPNYGAGCPILPRSAEPAALSRIRSG
jgi:hypothetical protein